MMEYVLRMAWKTDDPVLVTPMSTLEHSQADHACVVRGQSVLLHSLQCRKGLQQISRIVKALTDLEDETKLLPVQSGVKVVISCRHHIHMPNMILRAQLLRAVFVGLNDLR